MDYKEVYEAFVQDVKDHVVIVELDQGVFRHLVCKKPGTTIQSFEITTWPGYLAVTGDMGAFLFSRVNDMFEFFRTGKEPWMISFGYWAEKCQAVDRRDGFRQFSAKRFDEVVLDWISEWPEEAKEEAKEALLNKDFGTEDKARYEAAHVRCTDLSDGTLYDFSDFFEADVTEYTWHFIWCCYAIEWAIKKYDERRT